MVYYQSWPSTLPLSLVGVGDYCVVRKVDYIFKRLFWSLPRFTHEDTINNLYLNKGMEVFYFVIDTSWVYIHYYW